MIRKRTNSRPSRIQESPLWQNCKTLRTLTQIHASLIIKGFTSNTSSLRELIFASAISIHSTMHYAHQLFDQIPNPDTFMYNTMIRGSAQSPNPRDAISVFTRMENSGVRANDFTFPALLKACTRLKWVRTGIGIHGKTIRLGFERNGFLRNTLIYFHANCGDLSVARRVFDGFGIRDVVAWSGLISGYARRGRLDLARGLFDRMPVKDLVSWNVMITGYVKMGEMGRALELFRECPERDVVTWNSMISGYVKSRDFGKAIEMYEEMGRVGINADEVTMVSLLSACGSLGDLEAGEGLHRRLPEGYSVVVGNAVIDMYAKCGSIEKAVGVFRGMREKDVSSWNSIIGGLAFHGLPEESVWWFNEMRRLNVRPDEITFVGVLMACSHAGRVKEGRRFFGLMSGVYDIEPNIRHYGCMIDLLGRAGLLREAFDFIGEMKVKPNAVIWRTLLGACKIHGNVELGRIANEQLLLMRHEESGDYVLLSNIYATYGEWGGAEQVRKSMDDNGIKKEPGYSLVDAADNKALMHFLFDSKQTSNARNHAQAANGW